ncbi:uncharacterized protein O3Q21_012574 isoform 2-T2 [Podargus strigoides]
MAAVGGGACPGGGATLEEECEVVRVRVKKSEGPLPPEFRSFAVDPQITSLDVLQHILARAFDLQGKKSFSISFAVCDPQGQESFVPLLSDGDLAAAFACARPTLRLRLDVRPPAESPLLEDWDIISPREVAAAEPLPERRSILAAALPFTQAVLAQVGRTLARAQAALAWPEGSPPSPPPPPPPCAPLSDADLRTYLGPGGRLLRPHDLRLHVYHGGVEPGLRKVVWRYLLNVFPAGLSGQERLAHLRQKAGEYAVLKALLPARAAPAELALVGAAVRKDVVRTDRGHPYFGGPEEGHPHLDALQALLTTFALGHPRLSYCQGMSDVAAPLLAVLDDEAQAFLCFCALMRRLAPRFRPGGRGLARAFAHLRRLLRRADPQFWAFLAARGAHDLLFCYRWLLLELKREFAFEDALRVLEITWSSLPPAPPPPGHGVPLLGAPLGPRRAHRGLRERRGLRPRPPRHRQQRGGEVPAEATGGQGVPEACGDSQEGPGSSSDGQDGSRASADVPEVSTSTDKEEPKSSRSIQEGSKSSRSIQGDPESSRSIQEGSKSSRNIQGDPESSRSIQGDPESSSDGGRGPDGPRDVGEDPVVLVDRDPGALGVLRGANAAEGLHAHPGTPGGVCGDPDGPRKSREGHEVSKKSCEDLSALGKVSGDHGDPETPKDIRGDPETPKDIGGDPKGIRGNPKTPKDIGRDREVPKNIRGDPKEIGRDPETPKDIREGPKDSSRDPEGPKDIGGDPKVPREIREDPKDIGGDPEDPREVGSTLAEDGPVQHPNGDEAFSHLSVDQYQQPNWELFTCVALRPPSMDQYSLYPGSFHPHGLASSQYGPVWANTASTQDLFTHMALSPTSMDQYGPVQASTWDLLNHVDLSPPSLDQYGPVQPLPGIFSPTWPCVLPVWTSTASAQDLFIHMALRSPSMDQYGLSLPARR